MCSNSPKCSLLYFFLSPVRFQTPLLFSSRIISGKVASVFSLDAAEDTDAVADRFWTTLDGRQKEEEQVEETASEEYVPRFPYEPGTLTVTLAAGGRLAVAEVFQGGVGRGEGGAVGGR